MIISLADYKSLTGTTSADDDSVLSALLPGINDLVEHYCDRHFDAANYRVWLRNSNPIILPEYPINKILMTGYPCLSAKLSWASTSNINVEVRSDSVVITDVNNPSLIEQTFLFTLYPTLTALKLKIEDDWDITVTIEAGYETTSSLLLKTGTGKDWYVAVRAEADYRVLDDSERCLELYGSWIAYQDPQWHLDNGFFIMWNAGYTAATMPKGLQLTVAYILRDWLGVKKLGSKGMLKSETITHFSYTNFSPNEYNLKNILDNYYGDLEPYVKKQL